MKNLHITYGGFTAVAVISWSLGRKTGKTTLLLKKREDANAAVQAWQAKVTPGIMLTYETIEIWGEYK